MISYNDYHRLLGRGRKAGLNLHELNQLLAIPPAQGAEPTPGQGDAGGYASEVDSQGYQLVRQAGPGPGA